LGGKERKIKIWAKPSNIAIKRSFSFLVKRSGTELKKKFGWRSLQDFGTLYPMLGSCEYLEQRGIAASGF